MASEPVFTGVLQVGVVVDNVDAAVKKYADDYGIGPWTIYEFNPDTVKNMIVRNQRVDYAMRLALCDVGGVQWELIEPKDDKSIYYEFLKKHGPGLHHVAFGVKNYDKVMEAMRAAGKTILQGGTWHGFTYTYLTTEKDLGVIAEIYNVPEGFVWPKPDGVYPVD